MKWNKKILNKITVSQRFNQKHSNNLLFKKALYFSFLLILITILSFYIFSEDLNISLITFNVIIITSLFITEIYIYFEIIRMYKYKTKEIFYNRLFYLLLGDNKIELKDKICKSYINEESIDIY